MTRRLALAFGCAVFGGLAGAAAMILFYSLAPDLTIEMTQDRPGLMQGFYKGERIGELTFAWTSERGDVPLAGLDRNVPWIARVRLRGARQDPSTLPSVTVLADGVPLATRQTTNTFEDVEATVPVHPGRARGLLLTLQVSNTFVPGPGDSRRLGVQVDRITLVPASRGAFPPRHTVVVAAIASAIFGAIFGLLGATATTAVGAATLLAIAQGAVLRVGLGPFADWVGLIDPLAGGIGVALVATAFAVERWRGERLRNTARFALMFTGSALYLRLLVVLHPDKWLVDAVFHAHRLEAVMGGSYVFTSIAPGNYVFPYPIALYVAALPLATLVPDHVLLLRLVAGGVEAVSFLFLYWMVVRGTEDRLMAAVAVAVVQLMPLGYGVFAAANLTNVFGQAMAVITMALATVAMTAAPPAWMLYAATSAAAFAAFLSHTSTFATLSAMLVVASALLLLKGDGEGRRAGLRILMAFAVAFVLAVGLYYARFGSVYESQFARIRGEVSGTEAPGAPNPATLSPRLYQPGGASIPGRAARVLPDAAAFFTWPFLLLAVIGGIERLNDPGRRSWWLVVWGWVIAGSLLLLLGVLTPIDFRHYYAAMPAVAVLAASAVVALWRAGGHLRALAVIATGLGALIGVNHWLATLGTPLF